MKIATKPTGWALGVALAGGAMGGTAAAPAQGTGQTMSPAPAPTYSATFQVSTGRGRLVTLTRPMSDLFIADPSIADVQIRTPTQLYIFGKKTGETTVSATGKGGGVVWQATVRVGTNYDSVGQMLTLAMPGAHILATSMNGLILLTGTVATPEEAADAERLVGAFVGPDTKVLSRLKTATPLQVNLQVRFAEVSRTFSKNIGVRLTTNHPPVPRNGTVFLGNSGNAGTIVYDANTGGKTSTLLQGAERSTLGLAGHFLGTDILGALDLGEREGQVTTLANPNLTALAGETGTFLAGGEIPIPISQGLGAVSVEFKQYGVSLAYTPTVMSDGRISLRVRPEVSQLTTDGAVTINGTTIPALSTRRAETTVELGSGQSFMIAGLLQNNHNNAIDKTPGAGDLPVLGALFRSNSWLRNESELVIVITPYLVKPVNANDIVLPTDGYKAPTDAERVLMGQLTGYGSGGDRPKPMMAPPSQPVQPAIGATAPALPLPGREPQPDDGDRKAIAPKKPKKGTPAAPGFAN
jgi:pilus assembly protein CpaC